VQCGKVAERAIPLLRLISRQRPVMIAAARQALCRGINLNRDGLFSPLSTQAGELNTNQHGSEGHNI
jgi:hypothetical protein